VRSVTLSAVSNKCYELLLTSVRRIDMRISSKWNMALIMLGCWPGLGVHSVVAQSNSLAAKLFQELQSLQTTNTTKMELLKLGRSDPGVRKYLTAHVPSLIDSGPSVATCSGYNPCPTWTNAVELAGNFKIGEAAPPWRGGSR
jgi:hypothetical protein